MGPSKGGIAAQSVTVGKDPGRAGPLLEGMNVAAVGDSFLVFAPEEAVEDFPPEGGAGGCFDGVVLEDMMDRKLLWLYAENRCKDDGVE